MLVREFQGFLRKVEGIAEMTNKKQVKEDWPPYLSLLITISHKLANVSTPTATSNTRTDCLVKVVKIKLQHGLAYTFLNGSCLLNNSTIWFLRMSLNSTSQNIAYSKKLHVI